MPVSTPEPFAAVSSTRSRPRAGTLELRRVSKWFPTATDDLHVLDDVSFRVAPGEFVSILGASGCGKSTLLRLIAGLDADYDGEVLLDGERVRGTSLQRGVVFQEHRLLPWLTVEENVALALINSPLPPSARRSSARSHLELVGLGGFETAYPYQLSGGMAQRAAIARGLVTRPEILLLDEPFGALDALTRIQLQGELRRIVDHEAITTILVTHDVEEAIMLSNRIVILDPRPGRVRAELPVTLPHPRDRTSHAVSDVKRRILDSMSLRFKQPV